MQNWEYMRLDASFFGKKANVWLNNVQVLKNVELPDFYNHLNKLGGEGWEMIGMALTEGNDHEISYLKRAI